MQRKKVKELREVRGVAMVGRSEVHSGQVEQEIKIDKRRECERFHSYRKGGRAQVTIVPYFSGVILLRGSNADG